MALDDAVSCLLCLDAFERPTMLRIHLRPIGGGDPREYYLCQRCGGAIAAEYLYVQESGKKVSAAEPHDPQDSERLNVDGRGQQNTMAETDPAIEAAAASTVGEIQTVVDPKGTQKGHKKG